MIQIRTNQNQDGYLLYAKFDMGGEKVIALVSDKIYLDREGEMELVKFCKDFFDEEISNIKEITKAEYDKGNKIRIIV